MLSSLIYVYSKGIYIYIILAEGDNVKTPTLNVYPSEKEHKKKVNALDKRPFFFFNLSVFETQFIFLSF